MAEDEEIDCIDRNVSIAGNFLDSDPVGYLSGIILIQIPIITLTQTLLHLILKRFGEPPVVAQILGGIIMGPSFYGGVDIFQEMFFPLRSYFTIETLGKFGSMIYLFLVAVKMDLGIIKRSSKKEMVIGILTFSLPLVFTVPLSFFFRRSAKVEMKDALPLIAVIESTTSFQVIACLLADLKILNTELGRLATSVSTISGTCSWITLMITFSVYENRHATPTKWVLLIFCILGQVIFITVVLRKIVILMIKKTSKDKTIKEMHLVTIYAMILGTGIIGECLGQHYMFGPIILGFAIPDGPPVGSALESKLDFLSSGLLLPLYLYCIGINTNMASITSRTSMYVELFYILAFLGKLIGTIGPCLFYKMPSRDAFMLALILSSLGIYDLTTYNIARDEKHIDGECFSTMVLTALLLSAVISPLVYWFYNPSGKYMIYKKYAIQNAKYNDILRILVCIFKEDNVPTIINCLEASNPTKGSPITIYVLHLVELMGRSTSVLVSHSHRHHEMIIDTATTSDRIIKNFNIYEKQKNGSVIVKPFTATTPFVSADEDICAMALERRTSFIIIPFYKKWNIDGSMETQKHRNVNQNVLNKAPCSVGILIDRASLKPAKSISLSPSAYTVCVIFLGGADDREAICYAIRMTKHPKIQLVVHRFILVNVSHNATDKILDNEVIDEYRLHANGNKRNIYKEELVNDGLAILKAIRDMENAHDLILVGRRHETYSTLLSGLREWTEYPELGFFGDMFASSNYKANASVLVIQQHSSISNDMMLEGSGEIHHRNLTS